MTDTPNTQAQKKTFPGSHLSALHTINRQPKDRKKNRNDKSSFI
jgi:hypothetical protein